MINKSITILYVADQNRSKEFYKKVLAIDPFLDVPGMTEFKITETHELGLMPEKGIAKILGDAVPNPSTGNGIPRCEVYLYVDEPEVYFERALQAGAKLINNIELRDWDDHVGYVADPDGHVIAFARKK